jgi:putative endonuclease
VIQLFDKKTIGNNAEKAAKRYLEKQGLKFVDKNFHCRHGEIDLIFKDKQTLVFVEVRYRKNSAYGHSIETVNTYKQQKIITAAKYYLHKHKMTESISSRFDVIGIEEIKNDKTSDQQINWIQNAFFEGY